MQQKVVLGMSGGVDSSVAAHILLEQGYNVIGLFMKNWQEDAHCPQTEDYEDVLRVADTLKIPCHSINFVQEYQDLVFKSFLEDLKKGLTPNPDILCNKHIKFDVFFEYAKSLGADFIATGHYAQLDPSGHLLRGLDPQKDQSYFLHQVKQSTFEKVLFPIGHMLKLELRKKAKTLNLATAAKKDSTGICFIGKRDFRSFTAGFLGYQKGPIRCINTGRYLTDHEGAAFYTYGQRKGLKIGGPGDAWFVVDKDIEKNIVYVAQGDDHPGLYHSELIANNLNWFIDPKEELPQLLSAKIRYRQEDQPCEILSLHDGTLHVRFNTPQRAITPGQSIVLYDGHRCLGGGQIISRSR